MSLHKISHLPTEKLIGIEAHWLELVTGDSAVGLSGLKSEIKRVIATFTRRIPQRTVEHHRSRRGLRLFTQDDGMVRLQGLLLPEAAAALARCFDVINTPVHTRLGRGDATTTSGDVENVVKDPRSAMQKNHDALVTIANAALTSSELPTPNGKPAVVLLHTTEDRAKDPEGTAVIAGHDGSPALIPASSVRQTACAGALQRLTLNSHGQPVALEHEQRCFTGHQRRAMAARDGGCIIPGCGIPPGWCEAHHVETWAATKRTRTGAGVLLCWFHHHTIKRADGRSGSKTIESKCDRPTNSTRVVGGSQHLVASTWSARVRTVRSFLPAGRSRPVQLHLLPTEPTLLQQRSGESVQASLPPQSPRRPEVVTQAMRTQPAAGRAHELLQTQQMLRSDPSPLTRADSVSNADNREPSGAEPLRYFPVNRPFASGEVPGTPLARTVTPPESLRSRLTVKQIVM